MNIIISKLCETLGQFSTKRISNSRLAMLIESLMNDYQVIYQSVRQNIKVLVKVKQTEIQLEQDIIRKQTPANDEVTRRIHVQDGGR